MTGTDTTAETTPAGAVAPTAATVHYDTLLAQHFSWMLGGDIPAAAARQADLLRDLGVSPAAGGGTAVDLGCGPGTQALALAGLGFAPVLAVDTSAALLDELTGLAAAAGADVRPVAADLRTALPDCAAPGTVHAVVCMGDTLTHLPAHGDVTTLLAATATALADGGHLVITYRDLTEPLHGTDRILPVRSGEDRIMTCFLEYADEERVTVHDLVHSRADDGTWQLRTSSYPKLRIASGWLERQCGEAGLTVRHSAPGARGLQVLHAVKGA